MSIKKNSSIYIQDMNNTINTYKDEIEALKNGIINLQNTNKNFDPNSPKDTNLYDIQMTNEYLETHESSNNFYDNYINEKDIFKLQNEITKLKNQNRRLKDALILQENNLKTLTDKIANLHNQLNHKDNQMKDTLINHENKINEIVKEKDKLLDESRTESFNEIEKIKRNNEEEINKKNYELQILNEKLENQQKIISNFFTFYNHHIELINNLQFLDCNAEKIEFDINDYDKNTKYSLYEIDIMNKLICNIIYDNKEMYELLSKYKDIIKENEIIKNEQKNELIKLEQAKFDNKYLKEQVNNLFKELAKKNYQYVNNSNCCSNNNLDLILQSYPNIDEPFNYMRNKIEKLENRLNEQIYKIEKK